MVPGKDLVDIAPAGSEKGGVEAGFLKSLLPEVEPEMIPPAIQAAPVAVGGFQHFAKTAVAAGKNPFEEAQIRVRPPQADSVALQIPSQERLFSPDFVGGILRFPIEKAYGIWG